MDSLSVLDPLAWEPSYLREHPAYAAGNALGWLYQSGNKQAATGYPLAGRLYLAKSGWLLLSVPNALVRGVFDALAEPGAELPTAGVMNVPNVDADVLNAHISVMTAEEVNKIGGDNISERGHMFGYTLGGLKEIDVKSVDGVSRVWIIQITSPALANIRKSYGLSPLPKDEPFHITIAARRKGVLSANNVSKLMDAAADESADFDNPSSRGELKTASDARTTYDCGCSGTCLCPSTCVCKKYGTCGAKHKTAAEQPNALSRTGKKDLLPGGEADNLPDREFSASTLAEGAKHEHEHTDNDQIAKEIAKDHLSEDPDYYEKQKEIEKKSYNPLAPSGSVYTQQLKNLLSFREPFIYDHSKPVFQNVTDHILKAKHRGDFILSARHKAHIYRSQLDPHYRYQMAQAAINGTLPQMNTTDRIVQLYGNDIFDSIGRWGKK